MSVVKFVLRILLNWGKGGGGVQDAKLTAGKENQCEQAIHILQNSQGPVEIVVARGPIPPAAGAAPEAVDAEGGAAEGVIETHESNNQLNLPPDQAVSVSVEDLGTSQGEKADMVFCRRKLQSRNIVGSLLGLCG
ncbi:hypothetical protein C0Q70_17019 [Pomacea canaliculata]|uniref:Uncharacterized protein n=1 Tax=Pomacea canaliculata TaxID=400727 RepID=A0A2T7NRG0_POMCA|nr:hypothetical protein C0Q70_17019 [Pomacea canaliculata]